MNTEVSLWAERSGKVVPCRVGEKGSFEGVQRNYWFEDGFADVELEGRYVLEVREVANEIREISDPVGGSKPDIVGKARMVVSPGRSSSRRVRRISIASTKSVGESGQPWRTPEKTVAEGNQDPSIRTV